MEISQLSYYKKLSDSKSFSREDEYNLITEYQTALTNGDNEKAKELKDYFIENNLKLVIFVAMRFAKVNPEILIDDMIQDGNIGLMRAVEKFQPELGHKFSTYAVLWIKQAIARGLEHSKEIRLPSHLVIHLRIYHRLCNEFNEKYSRYPEPEEIKPLMDISEEMFKTVVEMAVQPFQKNAVIPFREKGENLFSTDEWGLEEYIPDTQDSAPILIDYHIQKNILFKAIDRLPQRKQEILKRNFGIGYPEHSMEAIGKILKISRERVRQLKEESLKELRKLSELQELAG